MSLSSLFSDLAAHLQSPEFLAAARHADHPLAFIRNRKLPLHHLVAVLLCGMRASVQTELDPFFTHFLQQAQFLRTVTAQAFAKARAKLSLTALPKLNDWLILRAEHYGFITRWHGHRVVAADATTLRFGLRRSKVKNAAAADQIGFGLFLPGTELVLAATLYSLGANNERQMLFEHLDYLSSSDLLLLDRGYPCRWLVAVLNQRGIPFCMRVEKSGTSGFTCVRDFLRSGRAEQMVTLTAPNRSEAADYQCGREHQTVRLVRNVASNGKVSVLMTNLFDTHAFPASCFGNLYHKRWRIEEAFKRLKHRLNLEHVSGLSQQAVVQDVAAKILCDNLQTLTALTAHADAELPEIQRVNHAYAHAIIKRLLPALLLAIKVTRKIGKMLTEVLRLIAKEIYRHRPDVSKPRNHGAKPHKKMTQKNC